MNPVRLYRITNEYVKITTPKKEENKDVSLLDYFGGT